MNTNQIIAPVARTGTTVGTLGIPVRVKWLLSDEIAIGVIIISKLLVDGFDPIDVSQAANEIAI